MQMPFFGKERRIVIASETMKTTWSRYVNQSSKAELVIVKSLAEGKGKHHSTGVLDSRPFDLSAF